MLNARQQWKIYYRRLRVINRESAKATLDLLSWGTGVVFCGDDGSVRHVPLEQFYDAQVE